MKCFRLREEAVMVAGSHSGIRRMARPSGAQCWHWYWYRISFIRRSATAIGAQPSLVQRGSSEVGAWVAQATSA